jgi:hypothetical protein
VAEFLSAIPDVGASPQLPLRDTREKIRDIPNATDNAHINPVGVVNSKRKYASETVRRRKEVWTI